MDADGAPDGVAATPGAKEPALELAGLVKRFGETTAVDHIDLVVPRGSFFGLVGPNGAGKTTTLSMAVGCYAPTAAAPRSSGSTCGPTRSRPSGWSGCCPTAWPCPSG
jgi:ABC-2 type transport system ATP-binding protein